MRHEERARVRFFAKVKKTDTCWLWTANQTGTGYGAFNYRGRSSFKAHRASWILHYGEIPGKLLVCHHCDVKLCVRPDHLFLGTHSDNAQDCIRKGRPFAGRTTFGPYAKGRQLPWLIGPKATTCKRGHPRIPENQDLRYTQGGFRCRLCVRISEDARNARSRMRTLMKKQKAAAREPGEK